MRLVTIFVTGALLAASTGCGSAEAEGGAVTSPHDWKERVERELYASVEGPARSFIVSGVVNEAVIFGQEASVPERKQASRMVVGWMRARSKAAWTKDCSFMSESYKKPLVKDAHSVTNGKVTSCPQALAYFGPEVSGNLVNTTTGPIDSLRAQGKRGFALYHGRGGIDWSVRMERGKGKWWVAQGAPAALNGGSNDASASGR
jgi:hypothetical protein